ncbi:hypothetical protein [Hyphomicrobium sulfonivorans]|uniref:hypothetical protein n=1 Tax=Hyphomicrobium sulfonivorans TaxID=121290 RepID=UPI0015707E6B|nr:hypothetical protein [Hyphomicrobium sulfonivorans]MBI1649872.1 hypothetical protein [Hyphomicrobium sulfonivorans]NSL71783.1 hypothetical protein [Hyphomicrobium sulfonivorans]
MNLVGFALRIATVELLRNATLAGDRVRDSMIDPANLLTQDAQPFIVVAIDQSEITPTGRDILGANRTISLTMDVALAGKVSIPAGDDGPQDDVVIPHTDAGMELVLDLIGRQIDRALLANGPWAKIWRRFAPAIKKVQVDRGASAENGIRYATRQIIFTLQAIAEPSFGEPEGVWTEFLALMRADAKLARIADLIETEIGSPTLDGWAKAQADLGLNSQFSFGNGTVPLTDAPAPPVTSVDVQFPGGGWSADAESIDDALGPEPSP